MTEVKSHTAAVKIIDFLRDKVSLNILHIKCLYLNFRLKRLANFCKANFAENEIKRKQIRSVWEREIITLVGKFSKKGTPEAKHKEKILIEFSTEQRDKIIQEYLDRCKIRHANLYYQWRMHYLDKINDSKSKYIKYSS